MNRIYESSRDGLVTASYYDLKILLSCIDRRRTQKNGQFYLDAIARKIQNLGGLASVW